MGRRAAGIGVLILGEDRGTEDSVARLVGEPSVVLTAGGNQDKLAGRIADRRETWWLVVEPGALLEPTLLNRAESLVKESPDHAGWIWDCSVLDEYGAPTGQVDVGGWSIERARWQDYTGPIALVRSEPLAAALYDGLELVRHRALLRASRSGPIGYDEEPMATITHDEVTDVPAEVRQAVIRKLPYGLTDGGLPRTLSSWPSISIVIPTRGASGRVRGHDQRLIDIALRSISRTAHDLRPEIVLVSDDDRLLADIDAHRDRFPGGFHRVSQGEPASHGGRWNAGIAAASGEVVVLLHDDVEALSPYWLRDIVALALEPDVGAVGALLLGEDGTVAHAGVLFDAGVRFADAGEPVGPGPRRRNLADRDVTAVSAACLAQRRSVWEQVGGFDPLLPGVFGDADYCTRILSSGRRVVQCNAAQLHHFAEPLDTRELPEWAEDVLQRRVGDLWDDDPFTPAPDDVADEPAVGLFRRRRRANRRRRRGGLLG